MRLIENNWYKKDARKDEEEEFASSLHFLQTENNLVDQENIKFLDEVQKTRFLSPKELLLSQEAWHSPFLLPDMEKACRFICEAMKKKQRIAVYGDYDCDGITASSIVKLFFQDIGYPVDFFIPHRMTDGYGISKEQVNGIIKAQIDLVITVDCGIANGIEIDLLNKAGIQVIVTDHHEVKAELPEALAVINPKRADSQYPFLQICGATVALKLVCALNTTLNKVNVYVKENMWMEYLDLAAIATLADVVSLVDENRWIVQEGISILNQKPRLGVKALTDIIALQRQDKDNIPAIALSPNHITSEQMTVTDINYSLIPRLNASGRMGTARKGVELFLTNDWQEAWEIAKDLNHSNLQRQEIEVQIVKEAITQIESDNHFLDPGPIVIVGKNWHPGVIGIVASRLLQRYYKPVIVLTTESGEAGILKGSARSTDNFNIFDCLQATAECLSKFGGHPKAAGLSLPNQNILIFKEKLKEYSLHSQTEAENLYSIAIDLELDSSYLTISNIEALEIFQPFGEGNPEPVFVLPKARVSFVEPSKNLQHLRFKFYVSDPQTLEGKEIEGIYFNSGELAKLYQVNDIVDVICRLSINEWNGKKKISLLIQSICFEKTGKMLFDQPEILTTLYQNQLSWKNLAALNKTSIESLIPTKQTFKQVYPFLVGLGKDEFHYCDVKLLAKLIERSAKIELNPFQLILILMVFQEAELIDLFSVSWPRCALIVLPIQKKVALEKTNTFQKLLPFINGDDRGDVNEK